MAQQPGVDREYTVFEDSDGREYFLIPQGDDIVKKVYLDEQNPTGDDRGPQDVHDHFGDDNQPPYYPNHGLAIPENENAYSPPPPQSRDNIQLENGQYPDNAYVQSPSHSSGKLEPVREEDHDHDQEQEEPLFKENPKTVPTTQESESPEDSPYAGTPQQSSRHSKQNSYYDSPVYTPKEIPRYQHRQHSENERSSQNAASPRSYRPNKKHPVYKPEALAQQQSAMANGMLIVDNEPWEAKSKTDHKNTNYRRGGGNVVIPNENLKWKASHRIDASNKNYQRGGGDKGIVDEKLSWERKPKVDHVNPSYRKNGGDVLIFHENLKWRKNPKKSRKNHGDDKDTSRSFSSENVHTIPEDLYVSVVEEKPKSADARLKVNPINSISSYGNLAKKGGYAMKYKGIVNRTKHKELPPLNEIIPNAAHSKELPIKPEKKTTNATANQLQQQPFQEIKQYSPRHIPNNRPAFRLPAKKEPIPPIISDINESHIEHQKKVRPITYVPPMNKSLPWKERNVEKVSAKALDDMNTSYGNDYAKQGSFKQPYVAYQDEYYNYDNYGGSYNYEEDEYYYNEEAYGEPSANKSGGYKSNHKVRENHRHKNKFTSVQNQHHFPSRKRNEPVY